MNNDFKLRFITNLETTVLWFVRHQLTFNCLQLAFRPKSWITRAIMYWVLPQLSRKRRSYKATPSNSRFSLEILRKIVQLPSHGLLLNLQTQSCKSKQTVKIEPKNIKCWKKWKRYNINHFHECIIFCSGYFSHLPQNAAWMASGSTQYSPSSKAQERRECFTSAPFLSVGVSLPFS